MAHRNSVITNHFPGSLYLCSVYPFKVALSVLAQRAKNIKLEKIIIFLGLSRRGARLVKAVTNCPSALCCVADEGGGQKKVSFLGFSTGGFHTI